MFTQFRAWKLGVLLMLVLLDSLTALLPVQAQDNPNLPIAGVQNGQLMVFNTDAQPKPIAGGGTQHILHLAWSDDGHYLAFTSYADGNSTITLWVTDGNNPPVQLANGLSGVYPPSFLPGSSDILYAVPTGTYQPEPGALGGQGQVHNIFSIAPSVGSTPTQLGAIASGEGCGGGSPYPADWAYWSESAFGGTPLVLAMTPYGLLYNINCTGMGLAMMDLQTGTSQPVLPEALGRIALSADRTQLVGLTPDHKTYQVNLQTRQATALPTAIQPDQLAWGENGDVFYSTRESIGLLDMSAADQVKLQQVIGSDTAAQIDKKHVTIHRFNTQSNSDTVIYEADAWAIGRMFVIPGGNVLVFSQVPNMQGWVQALVAGTIDPTTATNDQQLATIPTQLFRMDLSTGKAEQIASGINRATLNTSMYHS